jgi:flagellar basal body-associated protein FliL
METFKNETKKHSQKALTWAIVAFTVFVFLGGVIFLYFYNVSLKKNHTDTKAPPKTEEENSGSDTGTNGALKPDQKYLEPVTETPIPEGMRGPSPVPVIVVPKN